MYIPNSPWTWAFFLVSLAQAMVALALEGYIFARFQIELKLQGKSPPEAKTIPTYLSVIMFGYIYQLVLVYDALRLKNTIQVIGLCLCNVGLLVYAAIQMDQIHDAFNYLFDNKLIDEVFWDQAKPVLIALPCLVAFGTLVLSFIAWKLYNEFAWTIYKQISADLRLKRKYLLYQIYIALLKFDFFFFLGFTVQFLVVVNKNQDREFWLTIAAVPITIAILLFAAYFTRHESVLGMICVIILFFGGLAYFLFKAIRMYLSDLRAQDYRPARRSLTTFAVITILLLVVTIIVACWCTHNFNKGLKPHISRKKHTDVHEAKMGGDMEMPAIGGSGPAMSRMTID